MIGYTTIGVQDIEKAKKFYCDLFAEQGGKVAMDVGRIAFVSTDKGGPMLAVCEPFDKSDPQPGNGTMVAFGMDEKPQVDAMYARAIELGATDEGEPGQRIPDQFYGAYVRDADNNKLCFFVFG